MVLRVRKLRQGEERKHLELLNTCFQPWGDENKWGRLYGQSNFDPYENVLVVEDSEEWAGAVSTWFREAILKQGLKLKVYVAGDGCVDPKHRGKGVYSVFMTSANDHAKKNGACLGFGFISIFEVPFVALPKYGFIDAFYPKTKVLALHPAEFLNYLEKQVKEVSFAEKFEGIKLRLVLSFRVEGRKMNVAKTYEVKNRVLSEAQGKTIASDHIDLSVRTDIGTLLDIFRQFHMKRRRVYASVFTAFLVGRLRFGFSRDFLKRMIRS
jgi:GNAT superfamily N-acetyltransferase